MDKVVVITGASSGIGESFARFAATKGAKLVLAARRKAELEKVAAECGAETIAVVTDVTKRAEVEKLRDAALAKFGRIDVWVNNAGRGVSKLVAELNDEDIDEMIRDNVKSVVYGMQAVLPHFKSKNAGQIVNISSALARLPFASIRSAYSASKAAVNNLAASLRVELHSQFPGIAVSVVMPGIVATDFGLNARGGGFDSRKMPGAQPVEEVAAVIWDVIEHPRAEAYTQPHMLGMVVKHVQDPAAVEAEIAVRFAR